MQPTAQTGIVWKISIFLLLLLAVVLYKMNDYFKQEKWQLAQNQLRTQIVSLKTSVSSQISTLKNVLSSYEYELSESKINWVQLDPFFGIATAQKTGGRGSNQYQIQQFIGRSGSLGEKWNASFLEKSLSHQVSNSDQPITVQLFQDASGAKYMSMRFANNSGRALIVVGGAEYFQKYFDLSRGGKVTALLQTSENTLAAHSEADYLGTSMEENAISPKKFLVEKEDIAGTNLVVMNFMNRKALTKGFAVPWSVVGLIIGFGMLIVGVLIYTMDPLERRIEKYKMQEREQVFKETLSDALPQNLKPNQPVSSPPLAAPPVQATPPPIAPAIQTATDLVMAKMQKPIESPRVEIKDEDVDFGSVVLDDVSFESNGEFKINKDMKPVSHPIAVEPEPVDHEETFVTKNYGDDKSTFEKSKIKQNTGVFSIDELGENKIDPEHTYVPSQNNSSVRTGSVVLDMSDIEPLDIPIPKILSVTKTSTDSENFDLDQVLSLDEADAEEPEQKTSLFVQENLTSKKINTTQQMAEVKKPQFAVKRKEFKVDEFQVSVRRPDRS